MYVTKKKDEGLHSASGLTFLIFPHILKLKSFQVVNQRVSRNHLTCGSYNSYYHQSADFYIKC